MWFSKLFYFLFGFFPPNLGLDFGIRSFKYLPFGPSLIAFVHMHPIYSSMKVTICLTSINHLTHDMFDVATWHLLLLFRHCFFFFFPFVGNHLGIKKLKYVFNDSFIMIGQSFKRNTFCENEQQLCLQLRSCQ